MTQKSRREVTVGVRVTDSEKDFMEKFASYLYHAGIIPENTISEMVRYCVFNVAAPLHLKEIEAKRFSEVSEHAEEA